MNRRILVLGPKNSPYMMGSYARAFAALGHKVEEFDFDAEIRRIVPLGPAGRTMFRVLRHEPWIVRANRRLVAYARELACDLVVIPGVSAVRAGALAQIKASIPGCQAALLWPDPLQNLGTPSIQSLPMCDVVATYSSASKPLLEKLGAPKVAWIPFGADHLLFKPQTLTAAERAEFESEVCFVGNPRPERERAIAALVKAGVRVKVWGGQGWLTEAKDKSLAKSYFQGRELLGADFYKAMSCAKLGLNVMDDTNYPAANMRFFEGPACGTPMISSACPELENVFEHKKSVVYFHNHEELVGLTRELLRDEATRIAIGQEGQRLVLDKHTYVHRAQELLASLAQ